MNIYEVKTISTFVHTYFIEAERLGHALDEVAMEDAGEEAIQEHIGEQIVSSRWVSFEETQELMEAAGAKGNRNTWGAYIHSIDYGVDRAESDDFFEEDWGQAYKSEWDTLETLEYDDPFAEMEEPMTVPVLEENESLPLHNMVNFLSNNQITLGAYPDPWPFETMNGLHGVAYNDTITTARYE